MLSRPLPGPCTGAAGAQLPAASPPGMLYLKQIALPLFGVQGALWMLCKARGSKIPRCHLSQHQGRVPRSPSLGAQTPTSPRLDRASDCLHHSSCQAADPRGKPIPADPSLHAGCPEGGRQRFPSAVLGGRLFSCPLQLS